MLRRGLGPLGGGGGEHGGGGGNDDEDPRLTEHGTEIDQSVNRRSLRFEEWKKKKDEGKNDPKVTKKYVIDHFRHTQSHPNLSHQFRNLSYLSNCCSNW